MKARLTFADLSPVEAVVSFRLHEGTGHWLPVPPPVLDLMAGVPLIYSGKLPVVCHVGSQTPDVRGLLASAGHRLSSAITYTGISGLHANLVALAGRGRKVVVSHIPLPGLLHPDAYVVPPAVQIELNHKANLGRFAPPPYVLPRYCVPVSALLDPKNSPISPPVVLKAATKLPTGAGFDVVICRDDRELERGRVLFKRASDTIDGVVVESFEEFARSWCAQVAIDGDRIVYLGAAEQVCSSDGRWLGNYCGTQHAAPSAIEPIAMAIAEAGRATGFRGFAGFDIGLDHAGKCWVFDLNFRACGSLVQLLLHADLCFDSGHTVSRNVRLESPLDMSVVARRLNSFIESRQFVPTAAFDGPAVGQGASLIVGYLIASSKEEIEELEPRLRGALRDGKAGDQGA